MRKQILIVDSDDRQIQRIAGVLKETALQSGKELDIFTVNTLDEAQEIMEEIDIDVLILDTVYKGLALDEHPGIKWAQKVRERQKYVPLPIVFVSSVEEPCVYAYREINCLGFLPRKFKREDLHRVLTKAMFHTTQREGDKNFCVRAQGMIYPIRIKDILYVEVWNRVLYIYQINGGVLEMSHKPLRDFQIEADSKCLIQCNKSMLLNTLYVEQLDSKEGRVLLKQDDIQLLVGKKYLSMVQKALRRRTPKYILK